LPLEGKDKDPSRSLVVADPVAPPPRASIRYNLVPTSSTCTNKDCKWSFASQRGFVIKNARFTPAAGLNVTATLKIEKAGQAVTVAIRQKLSSSGTRGTFGTLSTVQAKSTNP